MNARLPLSREHHSAERLSTRHGRQISHDVWGLVQRGLVYPAPYALFATFWRKPEGTGQPVTLDILRRLMKDVREEIHANYGSANTSAIVGVGFRLWQQWCAEAGTELPKGMQLCFPEEGSAYRSSVFSRSCGTFVDSQGDLWFHIKSDEESHCEGVFEFIRKRLEEEERCAHSPPGSNQKAATKSTRPDKRGGKVLGCRFSETLNNPADPVSVQEQTLVGFEDPVHVGASFVVAQRFVINWEHLLNMSPQQIEDLVGRTTEDILIPTHDDRSHIKSARVQDAQGNTMQVLRLSLPFGRARSLENDELRAKGASLRDEEGLYFAGYARSIQVLESIMNQQIGDTSGFMRDRLLSEMSANLGGFYYVPSQADLGLEPVRLKGVDETDWTRFPGVDWSRLDRHFDMSSPNGYMQYNHKNYLFEMSTMSEEDREKYLPPSQRVLQLLSSTFSRWQDNWYFDRRQEELQHLCAYVARKYGADKAREVMGLPVVERMGWAIKMSLGDAFVDPAYGFRGRKQDAKGNWYNGADTYRIHPAELIVGALPNIGLGQGRYVIDYAREDERIGNFFAGLSHASGVGHLVPGFQRMLDKGLGGLVAEVNARHDSTTDEKKRQFYRGVLRALEGVQEHCLAYAKLAGELAASMEPGRRAERDNLLAIQERMKRLSSAPPKTMLEAAQLIFTMHACLHLIGEPTAIGRLDQMLFPFYERDVANGQLDDEQAQEIIDCFWIKVGEKVQLNRQFVEDHQPYGNLAMGGMSGNYPQGAANNQWIQQVTVGGTVADGSPGEGKPAYNKVTLLCLRAARRLPLNAPCLSLRVRKDIPPEYLHEASLALLSGGAHPILLSDEKIIPGLQHSGDGVGNGTGETAFTPVAEKAGAVWRSEVALEAARDYACDGCYEPQLVGKNWFTLGGMSSLQPLEAALNQGKSWTTAGPMYFRGQRVSFTSPHPKDIRTFEQLLELFFEHLRWMYAKQVDGLLGVFGTMSAVCPSPLLSVFVDDCLDKGLDLYEGGARYNVVAPCFTGSSTVINSLYAIQKMVFDPDTAVTSLPELVEALICDWGYKMDEPFISTLAGPARIEAKAERYKKLREVAMALPRYGRGHQELDRMGDELLARIAETGMRVFTEPAEPTAQKMVELARRLGTPDKPFGGFQVQPGVGTFENYFEFGAMFGASADGRRLGETLASDLSPSPSFADQPVNHQEAGFLQSLAGFTGKGADAFTSGAPTDFNIREDFSAEALQRVLTAFAEGRGSNILTVTCANPETFAEAARSPEKYDVLRVRMGGWSEFFVAMYPGHQAQHQRRPLSTPDETR
ncbi:Dyp-type peroxidase [Archangium violaceum]|uniref:Formate acetyltransferase n=1 Tax=Archangium violaceum Cb vi76 TaxID=1406225 RepID=A0A084ST45_9BACT|nr:Dyp-type peroxidase [Archangium violaceum]KFA91630.1 formate acetyltransferase [Archangium violaceum Cb vi76]